MNTILILALLGCGTPLDPAEGVLGEGLLSPFPSQQLVGSNGHVAIPAGLLPEPVGGSPLPVESVTWRTGFSPAQVSTLRLAGMDPLAFPGSVAPTPGEGSVRMLDVTDKRWLPCMAELDAADETNTPTLLVRPLELGAPGHEIAVFVTTDAVARPETFELIMSGGAKGVNELVSDTERIVEAAEELGLSADEIAAAWSYPVSDGGLPLRSAVEQAEPAADLSWARVRRVDAGDELPVYTFAAADGFVTTNSFLVDDTDLQLDASGAAVPSGEDHEAYIWVSVPSSVADAPAGSVPVLLFGHGIFGHPRGYLDTDDKQQVQRLAHELGAIVVALTWHGMASADRVQVLQVGGDFGRLPTVPGRMVQGHAAWASVIRAIQEEELLSDDALLGASGQVLANPDELVYYGISLGGIEGQILQSQHPEIGSAVFHVPGGMWSSLLERSSQWLPFDVVIGDSLPESADRQVLYAASQLWWDMVDPATFSAELADRSFILQESTGDEQVANFTTRTLARSAGVPVLLPTADEPWGLEGAEPSSTLTSALVQLDSELGLPVDANRPGANSGAHSVPRTWPGSRQQVVHMLATGEIAHFCGAEVCSESNPGVDAEPEP